MPTSNNTPLLLYDGTCGFCNKSVQTVLKYDRRGTMQFAPLQSEPGKEIVARHPELADIDSVVFVEAASDDKPERVFVRSDAALRVLDYLGGAWKLLSIGRIVPRRIRDFMYDLFAKHRYRFFGRYDSCLLPPPDVRSRFLE